MADRATAESCLEEPTKRVVPDIAGVWTSSPALVIPAFAGIQGLRHRRARVDARFRGHEDGSRRTALRNDTGVYMMPTFEEVLNALAAHERVRPSQTKLLSGLGSRESGRLAAVWSGLPDPERLRLLATLRRQAEEDHLLDFGAVYQMAMSDPNADLRRLAIIASAQEERPQLLPRLLELCDRDPDEMVREAAAERLAAFAYEAEVGGLPESQGREIERVLLKRVQSETEAPNVRAAALASVGYFSTESVRAEVRRALTRDSLRIAALRAIGRNCDPIWTSELVQQMGNADPAVRREAAEAAADYEDTVAALSDLVDDPDLSVRLAAISSLGTIGGPQAYEVLVYCYESHDPAIKKAATEAIREIEADEDPMGTVGRDLSEQ